MARGIINIRTDPTMQILMITHLISPVKKINSRISSVTEKFLTEWVSAPRLITSAPVRAVLPYRLCGNTP